LHVAREFLCSVEAGCKHCYTPFTLLILLYSVDGRQFQRTERSLEGAVTDGRQSWQSNSTHDYSSIGSIYTQHSLVSDGQSSSDSYLVPVDYEYVNQLGRNSGDYNDLDPTTINRVSLQHVYSTLSIQTWNTSRLTQTDPRNALHHTHHVVYSTNLDDECGEQATVVGRSIWQHVRRRPKWQNARRHF